MKIRIQRTEEINTTVIFLTKLETGGLTTLVKNKVSEINLMIGQIT